MKLIADGPLLYPLTSPPALPLPVPDVDITAKVMDYGDRKIWVTVPFPDTLELIAPIRNESEINPDLSGKPVKEIYKALDTSIKGMLDQWALGEQGFLSLGDRKYGEKYTARFDIRYDPERPLHRAFFWLFRSPGHDYGSWQAKLEFSPHKAGPLGIKRIEEAVGLAAHWLNFKAFLRDSRVSRLDAAVDFIGAQPLDLIGRIAKPGKKSVYIGDHGRPETIYHFEQKAHPKDPPVKLASKTTGPLRLTLYDRLAYDQQHAQTPAHGLCPVTRAEVSRRWKKPSQPALADLMIIKNQFLRTSVAYAAAVPETVGRRRKWRDFCMSAMGAGLNAATYAAATSGGFSMAKAYRSCVGDLVSEESWSDWAKGVVATGLTDWIEIANSVS